MTQKHVRARTAEAARRKAGGKRTTVSSVNYLIGTKGKNGMKTYNVITHKRKRKA